MRTVNGNLNRELEIAWAEVVRELVFDGINALEASVEASHAFGLTRREGAKLFQKFAQGLI